MSSQQITAKMEPLERRKSELAARVAQLDAAIADATTERARTLAGADSENVDTLTAQLYQLREQRTAAAEAIAHLEAQIHPLTQQLHQATVAEERAAAEGEYRRAHDAAIAAKEALRGEMRTFLAHFAQRMAELRKTQQLGREALRRRNLANGISLERADSGWNVDLFENAAEANLCTAVEQVTRANPPGLFAPISK